jgi:hypothetical protein
MTILQKTIKKVVFSSGDNITQSTFGDDFTIQSTKDSNRSISLKTNQDVNIYVNQEQNTVPQFVYREGNDGAELYIAEHGKIILGEAVGAPEIANDPADVQKLNISAGNEVSVNVLSSTWNFDSAGILTLPAGGDILDENGDSVLGTGSASGAPRLTIHGYLDGVTVPGTAKNFVTFTTGDDPISALYLTKYISTDNRAWFAIQVGSTWTASQTAITADHVAYGHFGPNAVIVNALGVNLLSTTNYTLLPNTTYTMWIQQINAIAEYAFSTSAFDQGGSAYETYSSNPASPTVTSFYTSIGSGPVILADNTKLSNAEFEGLTVHGPLVNSIRTKSGADLTVVHDIRTATTWYHSSISQNFTPNFTNVPTNNERSITCTLILAQGSTPYIPDAVKIDGTTQTVNWLGSSLPSGTANKKNVVTFTLIRTGSTWLVLGKLETYGSV